MNKKKSKGSGIWKRIGDLLPNSEFEIYDHELGRIIGYRVMEIIKQDKLTITLSVITEGGSKKSTFYKGSTVQLVLPETEEKEEKATGFSPRPIKATTFRGISID